MATNAEKAAILGQMELKPAVYRELDLLSLEQLERLYGPGYTETTYYQGQGYWKLGDGRPEMSFHDDPAAAQAAGRCCASRTRWGGLVTFGAGIHPTPCVWCDFPMDVLLKALDHAAVMSRFIVTEYVWWPAKDGAYARSTPREGTYENPIWRDFFAQPREGRAIAIAAATNVTYPPSP